NSGALPGSSPVVQGARLPIVRRSRRSPARFDRRLCGRTRNRHGRKRAFESGGSSRMAPARHWAAPDRELACTPSRCSVPGGSRVQPGGPEILRCTWFSGGWKKNRVLCLTLGKRGCHEDSFMLLSQIGADSWTI